MLVSSWNILSSEGEGPSRGTLIFARWFDSGEVERLSRTTLLSLMSFEIDDAGLPDDVRKALRSIDEGSDVDVRPLSSDTVAGYTLVDNIFGEPALVLRAEMPRGVVEQGRTTLLVLTIALVASGIVFLGLLLIVLERAVLSRLRRLSFSVKEVGASGELALRVPALGRDELADLGADINQTLETLEEAQRQRDQTREALERNEEQLRALSGRLVEVQESERQRLALELHDEIGQALTGVKLMLEQLQRAPDGGQQQALTEAQRMVNELIPRVRNLAQGLRPAMLDDLGLRAAVQAYVRRHSVQGGLQVEFDHSGLEGRFPRNIETAAYRIIQESLTNVARHAGVGMARVIVEGSDSSLRVRIQDAGKGFDLEQVMHTAGAQGLYGMRERARLLDGTLVIESEAGKGTRIQAEFPLSASE